MIRESLDINGAATALLDAYERRTAIASLPPGCQPDGLDEAYAIQSAFAARYPHGVAGYKIGAASPASQALVGASSPFVARVLADTLFAAPLSVPPGRFFSPSVEAELAFRIGVAIPPSATPRSRDAVAACIDAAYPAIEICDNRFTDWREVGLAQLVADNGFYGGLVLGRPIPDWRHRDLAQMHATMAVNGMTRGAGRCGPVLGDPIESVGWLLQAFAAQGITVEAGAVIAIGTWTGLFAVAPGQQALARFEDADQVEIWF